MSSVAVVAVLGRVLLAGSGMTPRRRGREGNSGMVLLFAGLGLVVIGAVGLHFARLIQAAVSRQQEYVAEALPFSSPEINSGLETFEVSGQDGCRFLATV